MATELERLCARIEEGYEFTLSYAAQGHGGEPGSAAEAQVREHLGRAAEAIRGLEAAAGEVAARGAAYRNFLGVLAAEARAALAAIELVLAQPGISSQTMDSLNASLHLRALLADLFLVSEVLAGK